MADYNGESREVETNKDGGISIKVNVDVSDALTGLKAVQREAREATKAVKELEAEGGRVTIDGDAVYRTIRASDSYIGTSGNKFLRSSIEGKVNSSGRNLRIKIGEGMYDSSILIIDDDTGNLTKITDLKELLSDVTTAQLVEELESRDDGGIKETLRSSEDLADLMSRHLPITEENSLSLIHAISEGKSKVMLESAGKYSEVVE